jgi:hypothetical protein
MSEKFQFGSVEEWGNDDTSRTGVEIRAPRRITVDWQCCGMREDVTGQQYVYPGRHVCQSRDAVGIVEVSE